MKQSSKSVLNLILDDDTRDNISVGSDNQQVIVVPVYKSTKIYESNNSRRNQNVAIKHIEDDCSLDTIKFLFWY